MAPQLSLVRLEDLVSDIDSINLLSGGFDLREWIQAIANEGDTSASEVLTLKITGTSQDNLASLVQSLDEKIKQANWRKDFSERYDVWLRAKMGNETNARQALILKAMRSPSTMLFDVVAGSNNIAREYQLGLERAPWWEDSFPYPSTTAITGVNSIGGIATLTETIRGDVNARLIKLTIVPVSPSNLSQFWIGWKTARFGNPANFLPVWSLNLGSNYNDTSDTVDASAYNGNRITTTFATQTGLVRRVQVFVNNVAAITAQDQRGVYSVLLRAKMSDSSVARARLGYGFGIADPNISPTFNSRQIISGTGYKFYEMGDVQIPSPSLPTSFLLNHFVIELDAERISGAGALHSDCLVMIPVDDSSIRLTTITDLTDQRRVIVFQESDDQIKSTVEAIGEPGAIVIHMEVKSRNWSLPANDAFPRLVFAAQGSTVQDKTHSADFTYTYTPRWATLRGSET